VDCDVDAWPPTHHAGSRTEPLQHVARSGRKIAANDQLVFYDHLNLASGIAKFGDCWIGWARRRYPPKPVVQGTDREAEAGWLLPPPCEAFVRARTKVRAGRQHRRYKPWHRPCRNSAGIQFQHPRPAVAAFAWLAVHLAANALPRLVMHFVCADRPSGEEDGRWEDEGGGYDRAGAPGALGPRQNDQGDCARSAPATEPGPEDPGLGRDHFRV
jgi:hypothetical protein